MADKRPQWSTVVAIGVVAAGAAWVITQRHSTPWATHEIVGLTVLVPAIVLWSLARLQLGPSFSIRPQARQLVTHGLYSRIRNPIYVFGELVILGIFTFLWMPWLFVLFLLLTPMQIFRARREARVLEATFGDQYRDWRRQTWF